MMTNILSKSSAIAGRQSSNYLENPVISSYFRSREIKAYYISIKHAYPKRDYHSTLITAFTEFLSIIDDDGIEILNAHIFNSNKASTQHADNIPPTSFEDIHPEGYKLLGLSSPVSLESLKSAYKKAAMKYHPDRGGTNDAMATINDAFKTYENHLCLNLEGRISKSHQEPDEFHMEPQCANDYIYLINAILAEVYCDEWDIHASYRIVRRLQDTEYYGSKMFTTGEEKYRLVELASTLTKRLTAANRKNESSDVMKFTRYIYTVGKHDYMPYVMEPEMILSGRKKLRIIINHPRQADNALSLGVITSDRYNKLCDRFAQRVAVDIEKKRLLNDFINNGRFIGKLPYDDCVTHQEYIKSTYVPEINYFENIKLHMLSPENQSEYFVAFSRKSSISLVKKYTYVRLASYILSINADNKNKLIDGICDECNLLYNIYDDSRQESHATKELIKELSDDMKSIRCLVGVDLKEKINYIKDRYKILTADRETVFSTTVSGSCQNNKCSI